MSLGYLQPGQRTSTQSETNFIVAQAVNSTPSVTGGKLAISNVPIGSVAYASLGTNTTDVAGQLWVTDIFIPYNRLISKIGFLSGATSTTDNFIVAVYNSLGNLRANSALAGQVLSGANTFQEVTLLTPLQCSGPSQLFIVIQGNGTAAGAIRTIATLTYPDVLGGVVAGTFATIPATITPLTSFTAGQAPFVYVK